MAKTYFENNGEATGANLREFSQISGVMDDGSPEGVVKAKITSGDLILLPVSKMSMNSVGGTGTASVSDRYNYWENIDRTSSAKTMLAPGYGSTAVLSCTFYGRTLGLRFRTSTNSSQLTPEFNSMIDAAGYFIGKDKIFRYNNNRLVAGQYDDNFVMIAENLPDTEHTLEIILTGDASIVNKSLILYGLIVDNRPGYDFSRIKGVGSIRDGGQLTDAFVNVPTTDNSGKVANGVRSITYFNSDVSARTVTIAYGLTTSIMAIKSLAPNETWQFDIHRDGASIYSPTQSGTIGLQHKADAVAKVNFFTSVN